MFRNREVRRFAALFAVLAVFMVATGFAVHPAAGILALISASVYGAAFFFFTRNRYRRIARLSEEIDRILHHGDRLELGGEEGELSILQCEIRKMTLRIREQNDALRWEKEHLADSLADIAHQLRTPLTSGNLILTLLEHAGPDERRGLLREMEELLVRMDWLLTSLLKLSRLDAGIIVFEPEWFPVRELIRAAKKPLLIGLDLHNIQLRENGLEEAHLYGDFGWLTEAVRNVLKNCMESAGDNGQIEIACQDTVLFTEITIRDHGKGIATEDLPHLFDRFYRGKHSGAAGYGIGLALCRQIITGQGGTVTAGNHPQGGAVFAIRFPREGPSDGHPSDRSAGFPRDAFG